MKTPFFLFFFLCISILCVVAQDTVPEGEEQTQEIDESELVFPETDTEESGPFVQPENRNLNNFGAWDFIRMFLILAAVIAAIYLVFFILKRTTNPRMQNNELFKVLSSQTLSNNRTIHLVEVGRQMFLVGAGDGSVRLLSEITDKETIDEIRLKMSEEYVGERRRFKDVLALLFRNGSDNKGTIYPLNVNESTNFIKKQRERLKNL